MAITRKVDTDVYCDICGKWVMGWTSNNDGVSRAWAAKYARKKGCTVGKKIICKECRIEKRIQTCSIQQKIGSAGRDSDGTCMGFGGGVSDALIKLFAGIGINISEVPESSYAVNTRNVVNTTKTLTAHRRKRGEWN